MKPNTQMNPTYADTERLEYSQAWFAVTLVILALLYLITENRIGAWHAVLKGLSGANATSDELFFAAFLSSIIVFVLPFVVMLAASLWIARVKCRHDPRSRLGSTRSR